MSKPVIKPLWTDAEILAVLRGWSAGQTAGQLAVIHGSTRNAILGLIHRMKAAAELLDSLSDRVLLGVLDEVERRCRTVEAVAKEFGVTRMVVLAARHVCHADAVAAGPCEAVRPENRDGGMPGLWWAKGLFLREDAA